MENGKIKAAIAGCGVISDIYLQNLTKRFDIIKVVACYDRNQWKMDDKQAKYGVKPMSLEEILNDPEITMLINLTSPAGHYPITSEALKHGKHVYTEKMMAVTLEEGRELCRLAEENHVRLGVAPDTFLGGSIQTARYILDKGLIGEPLSAVVSLNRDYNVFGGFLPHLHKEGGNLPFDCGCYYLTALASLLGPVDEVTAYARTFNPHRVSDRVDKPWFESEIDVEGENIVTAIMKYRCGVLATVHFNSENIINEKPILTIFGTDGILYMGDPNQFGSPVYIEKPCGEKIQFPFTHGYTENARGVGAAEMAWAIRGGRSHRAGKEMAFHVFEQIHGMILSARSGSKYSMTSTFERPAALPEGYQDNGFWGPCEESALI